MGRKIVWVHFPSCHCSAEAAASTWEQESSAASAPSPTSKTNPTLKPPSCPICEQESWTRPLSGTTSEILTASVFEDMLDVWLAGSHARTSRSQASALESVASVPDSGSSSRGSYAKWDRDSSLWKTFQALLLAEGSEAFLE